MATKDISDIQVLNAYAEWESNHKAMVDEILIKETGQSQKVVCKAMERADKRGLINFGVSLRTGWLTEKGKELLNGSM